MALSEGVNGVDMQLVTILNIVQGAGLNLNEI